MHREPASGKIGERPSGLDQILVRTFADANRHEYGEKRAAALLGLRDNQFRNLVANNPIGFILTEVLFTNGRATDSRMIYANEAFDQHYGLPRLPYLGRLVSEAIANPEPEWLEVNELVLRTGTPVSFLQYQRHIHRWTENYQFPIAERFVGNYFSDVTERQMVERSGTIEIDGLVIDFGARTARLDGNAVEFTRSEFDILSTLARSPGVVHQTSDLRDHYGGARGGNDEGSIEVHISRMRRKLGEDGAHPRFIHNVRGIGYRFAKPKA